METPPPYEEVRLLSTAPELYKLLREWIDIPWHVRYNDWVYMDCDFRKRVEAALFKVEV